MRDLLGLDNVEININVVSQFLPGVQKNYAEDTPVELEFKIVKGDVKFDGEDAQIITSLFIQVTITLAGSNNVLLIDTFGGFLATDFNIENEFLYAKIK